MMELVKCLSRSEAQRLVRHCLSDSKVIFGRHFRDELAADGFDIQDAVAVLRTGQIYNEPEVDVKTREWKYRIEGKSIDGDRLAIVFCFKTIDTCFCITAFALER